MLNEIVFVKRKLNAVGYQMFHGELLPFITEMEGKKIIFQRNNAPLDKAVSTKKWF